jgi:[acyl-carrier-protein] S-malonyltransferase
MKIAFLYAGQGSQKVGMGKDMYYEFPEYRKVIDGIVPLYKKLMEEGPEEKLSKTKYTQPCMAAFAAGVTAVLFSKGIVPDMAAGLSLGEYSALHAAHVFNAKELVDLLAFRGEVMGKAAKGISCKMTAVLGLEREKVQDVCKEAAQKGIGYVVIANYNCPGQYVLCGEEKAVEYAEGLAKNKGAKRCIPLNVSGPFHTKYMEPAGDALSERFKGLLFQKPSIPIVYNATGDFIKKDETIKGLLTKQVQSSVYFEDSIRKLLEEGVDTIIEIGPGKVLSGFVKKVSRKVAIFKIETAEELNTVINEMEGIRV